MIFLFIGVAVWLCLEYVILGPYSYVRIGDNLDIFIPQLAGLWRGFLSWGAAYWSPLFAGGIDRLGSDGAYFNAGSILFALFPTWLAYGLVLMLGAFLAGWFTFLVCERRLGLSRLASVVAGVLAAQGVMLVDIMPFVLGFGAFPAAIYYLERLCMEPRMKRAAAGAVALGLGFAFFSSLAFTLPFTLVVAAVWVVVIRRFVSWRSFFVVGLFGVVAIIPHLPEFWSLFSFTPFSIRGGEYYRTPWVYGIVLIRWLLDFYWVGALMLAIGVALRIRGRVWYGVVALSVLFLFVAPWYQPFSAAYGQYFGRFRDFGFERFYYLLPVVLGIATAMVLEHFSATYTIRGRQVRLRELVAGVVLAALALGSVNTKIVHAKGWLRNGSFYTNAYSPEAATVVGARTASGTPFRVATIADERTGLLPSWAVMQGWETIDGDITFASRRYAAFFKELTKHSGPEPKHSFYFMWQATADDRAQAGRDATRFLSPALLSLANVRHLFSPFPISLPGFRLLSPQDTALPAELPDASIAERARAAFRGRPLMVYENEDVFPRAFLVNDVRVFATDEELLQALGEASTSTLRTTAFVNVADMDAVSATGGTAAKVEVTASTPDEIIVTVQSDAPTMLVLTTNYRPAWRVHVDGEEKKIIPVYHTFMGVPLESGNHTVVWKYKP